MTILAAYNFFIGAAIGMRYRVMILIPAVFLGVAVVIIIEPIRGDDFTSSVWTMIVVLTSLQIGYVGGVLARFSAPRAKPISLLNQLGSNGLLIQTAAKGAAACANWALSALPRVHWGRGTKPRREMPR